MSAEFEQVKYFKELARTFTSFLVRLELCTLFLYGPGYRNQRPYQLLHRTVRHLHTEQGGGAAHHTGGGGISEASPGVPGHRPNHSKRHRWDKLQYCVK